MAPAGTCGPAASHETAGIVRSLPSSDPVLIVTAGAFVDAAWVSSEVLVASPSLHPPPLFLRFRSLRI